VKVVELVTVIVQVPLAFVFPVVPTRTARVGSSRDQRVA
jgi:hypothetical protein